MGAELDRGQVVEARQALANSSITVRHLQALAFGAGIEQEIIAQTWFAAEAGRGRDLSTRRRGRRRGNCSPASGVVGQCRPIHLEQFAGTPLREAAFASECNLLAPRLRAHPFRG